MDPSTRWTSIWARYNVRLIQMDLWSIFDADLFKWVILPLLIFSARIIDVSLSTLRIVFVSRGIRYLAPIVGFFEILVWLLAIGQIMVHMTNPLYYIAYAGGFALGTLIGMMIEERLSIGKVLIRVITRKDATELVGHLMGEDYSITYLDAQGKHGKVKIIYTIIDRHDVGDVVKLIKRYNPQAFYIIEDVRFVSEEISAHTQGWLHRHTPSISYFQRKGK